MHNDGVVEVLIESSFVVYIVFGLMVAVEYIDRLTTGRLMGWLRRRRFMQYLICSLLGATPGCAGAFAVVSLYMHRMVSIGAVTACMVATSGDEAFVMLSLFPKTALFLFLLLFFYGIFAGYIGDLVLGRRMEQCCAMPHGPDHKEKCGCVAFGSLGKETGWERFLLGGVGVGMGFLSGWRVFQSEGHMVEPAVMLGVSAFLVFSSLAASREYIRRHIGRHILLHHLPRVALWTFGAMLLAHLIHRSDLAKWVKDHQPYIMWIAAVVGIIPQSGPHFVFVSLHKQGFVPFSVLVCSSVVQDGHGMLPLFSHSFRSALYVKAVNIVLGLALGYLFYIVGY